MVLRFLEGFDSYGTSGNINALLQRKWETADPESAGNLSLATGYSGGFALEVATNALGVQHIFGSRPSEIVVGFWWKTNSVSGTSNEFVRFHGDGINQFHIGVEQTGTVFRVTRDGSVLATGTEVIAVDTWYFLELKGIPANSGGTAELRINRNVDISFSGDTSIDNSTTFSAVSFFGGFTRTYQFDDIYIIDATGSVNNDYLASSFGDIKVKALFPNGAGNSTELSVVGAASNYLATGVSTPDDDTSYVESSTTARDTYEIEDLDVSGEIIGVQNCISHRKDAMSNEIISSVVRTGGTDFVSNAEFMLVDYKNTCVVFDQNPDTSLDWTASDINSIEIGIDIFRPVVTLQGTGTVTSVGTVT